MAQGRYCSIVGWLICILFSPIHLADVALKEDGIDETRLQACLKILIAQTEKQVEWQDSLEDISSRLNISQKDASLHLLKSFWGEPDNSMTTNLMVCYSKINEDQLQSALVGNTPNETEAERLIFRDKPKDLPAWTSEHQSIVDSTFLAWLSPSSSLDGMLPQIKDILSRRARIWACIDLYVANTIDRGEIRKTAKTLSRTMGADFVKAQLYVFWEQWDPEDGNAKLMLANCVDKISENITEKINAYTESPKHHFHLLDAEDDTILGKWSLADHNTYIKLMSRLPKPSKPETTSSSDFDPDLALENETDPDLAADEKEDGVMKVEL